MWTPKTCVMVEVWLNRLNTAAWFWNLSNWVAHGDMGPRIWSLLIKKTYTKEAPCIWNLNRPLSFGYNSFLEVLKEVKPPIHQQQNPCALLFSLPWLPFLPPWLVWMCSPVVFWKAELSLESSLLLRESWLCMYASPGLRFDGGKFSLFSIGLLCKWIKENFCSMAGTMTSPEP